MNWIFDRWVSSGDRGSFANAYDPDTTFIMPPVDVTVTATYKRLFLLTISYGQIESFEPANGGIIRPDGRAGSFAAGTVITIRSDAYSVAANQVLAGWSSSPAVGEFSSTYSLRTTFTMPDADSVNVAMRINTIYDPDMQDRTLSIAAPEGPGSYPIGYGPAGTPIDIGISQIESNFGLPPDNYVFSHWVLDDGVGGFLNTMDLETTFFLSHGNAIIRPVFRPGHYLTVESGEVSGQYAEGRIVPIFADSPPQGMRFDSWIDFDELTVSSRGSSTTNVRIPTHDATVTATYVSVPYTLEVIGGSGSGSYILNTQVNIMANHPPTGQMFSHWQVVEGTEGKLADPTSAATTFRMYSENARIEAIFVDAFELTVVNGVGSGVFQPGTQVTIMAEQPAPGQVFDSWVTSDGGIFADASSAVTIFTMPGNNVTVTATYRVTVGAGGGGGGGGGDVNVVVDVPDETGETDYFVHRAYIRGIGNNLFAPNAQITRAQVAQIFYNLLDESGVQFTHSFSDIDNTAWYADAVNTLAALNIIVGYPDGSFRPNNNITRAEFVTLVLRFSGAEADMSAPTSFGDVTAAHWAYRFINSAVANGWIQGYEDGTFRPDIHMTRAEAVTITNRMLGRQADRQFIDANIELLPFTDVLRTHWAFYDIMEAALTHRFVRADDNSEIWQSIDD
jgi:hypothetical protein